MSGHHDHHALREGFLNLQECFNAIDAGHANIHKYQIEWTHRGELYGLVPIFGGNDAPALVLQYFMKGGSKVSIVVDNHDGVSHVVGLLETVAVRVILLRTPSRTANLHFAGRESFRRAA